MTIDEAIKHAKDKANANYENASAYHDDFGVYLKEETRCRECAEEHEQIAEWLEELKGLREDLEFFTYIANTMNPNEFQKYYEMFNSGNEKVEGAEE